MILSGLNYFAVGYSSPRTCGRMVFSMNWYTGCRQSLGKVTGSSWNLQIFLTLSLGVVYLQSITSDDNASDDDVQEARPTLPIKQYDTKNEVPKRRLRPREESNARAYLDLESTLWFLYCIHLLSFFLPPFLSFLSFFYDSFFFDLSIFGFLYHFYYHFTFDHVGLNGKTAGRSRGGSVGLVSRRGQSGKWGTDHLLT
ncbi:hypothetical protein OG21DRAFT_1022752 [Imleria badia]|nr:hypothetical protein OG21DRAFT_1022752 [Imleria badia]